MDLLVILYWPSELNKINVLLLSQLSQEVPMRLTIMELYMTVRFWLYEMLFVAW